MRRIRFFSGVATAITLAAFLLTRDREAGIKTADHWLICIGDGCLQVGYNPERFDGRPQEVPSNPEGGGFYWMHSWHSDWTMAWRPFHVAVPPSEMIVVPLWPLVFAGVGVYSWSSGYLRGVRRSRGQDCLCCGYDLSATAVSEGGRLCPECGSKRPDWA